MIIDLVGGTGGSAFTINKNHIFADNTARDSYFALNPTEKEDGILISVGSGYQEYNGANWIEKSPILKGNKGDKGDKGDTGEQGLQGIHGTSGQDASEIVSANFIGNDMVFSKDDTSTFSIINAKVSLTPNIENKQDLLVSGDNIKTVNGTSLLGGGDLVITSGESGLVKQFNAISEMKADLTLTIENEVEVLGYYSKNDGCTGKLKIMPAGSFLNTKNEGGLWFTLNNGLTATWVLEQSNHISIRQLGGKDDGVFNNTPAFLRARQLEGWVIDFTYITNGIYYLAGNRPLDGDKPLEAGFYYNPLDERIVIKMEDMTPSYFGNKADPKTFLGVINPIKFEFTHQNGKNMIIGKSAVIEESFLTNAPKVKHSRKDIIDINFNDGSWVGYNTPDYVADGNLNVFLGVKQLKWTANNPTMSRLGMVRKFNDNDLFEVACVRKTADSEVLYAYFVEKGTNNCVWLRIPLFGDTENQIKWYQTIGTTTSLKKVSSFDVTMGGKTADYFKIPVGGSMSLGLMKNGKDLFLYMNGVFIYKYTHTAEIDRIGLGNANAGMTTIEFWQPVVYKNSDIDSSRQLKVYCLGDSNTFGARSTMRWADYLPYVARQFEGLGDMLVTMVNATVDISSGGVGLLNFSGNDYVVVMLGINDSREAGDNVSIGETYNTNMTTLINKIIADGATPIICTFGMLFDGADTGNGYILSDTFKSGYLINRIKTTCAQRGVEIAEVRNFLSNNWDKFYSDALHYTNPAHLEISKAVCDAISRSITPKEINTTTRVSFNGTNGTIYKDYNVKSVTRTAQGRYKIDFVHPMKDIDYTLIGMTSNDGSSVPCLVSIDKDTQASPKTLTSCYVCVNDISDTNSFIDNVFVDLIFL